MSDYTLAIGRLDPYGFSSATDAEAVEHAAAYIRRNHGRELEATPDVAVTLGGPKGLLTRGGESVAAFVARGGYAGSGGSTEDVRPAEPTTPDCNTGGSAGPQS